MEKKKIIADMKWGKKKLSEDDTVVGINNLGRKYVGWVGEKIRKYQKNEASSRNFARGKHTVLYKGRQLRSVEVGIIAKMVNMR